MKKLIPIFALLMPISSIAQEGDSSVVKDSVATVKDLVDNNYGSSSNEFWNVVFVILLGLAVLFIIGHMIYTLITTKRFREQNHNVEYFKSLRQEKGKSAESTEEENTRCEELLDQVYNSWTYMVEDENGNEYRRPNKMKEIITTEKLLREVAEIAPTDEELVEVFNEYKKVIASNKERSFDGSKKIMILGLAMGVLISIIGSSSMPETGFLEALFTVGLFFIIPVGIYYIASYTPQFLIEKRANRGGGNVSSGLVAMALGVMGSGFTVRTRYTDGTYEDDNSAHGVALMLGIFAMIVVAFTISIWAVINYLRNYVLYF